MAIRRVWCVVRQALSAWPLCAVVAFPAVAGGADRAPEVICHDLSGYKFAEVDLADGVGSARAPELTEVWTITCPNGASPCPQPLGSSYSPIHSGRHGVDYVLTSVADGVIDQCSYHLDIGMPGLQVELEWEWDSGLGPETVDLDLHLHQPANTMPLGGDSGNENDCAWSNCKADSFDPSFPSPDAPQWFDPTNVPPDPVSWYLSPIFEENTCYLMPGSQGGLTWQSFGLGCHNPRLALDNVSCDPTVTDPQDSQYCHPETVNVDFMPAGEWTRIGVHYNSNHGQTYDVHPKVKVFCHRSLVVELGDASPSGFGSRVTFTPAQSSTLFWLVADVVFLEHPQGGAPRCIVRPLYANPERDPVFSTVAAVQTSFFPAYAGVPMPVFWDGFESGNAAAWSVTIPSE